MGIPEEQIECSIRMSWGANISIEEVKENIDKLLETAKQICS